MVILLEGIISIERSGVEVAIQVVHAGKSGSRCIATAECQFYRIVVDVIFINLVQVHLLVLVNDAHASFCIDIPVLERVEYHLSLQIDVIVVCFGTTAVSQLCQLSVAHIVSVRIFKWHCRPHTGNVMIQQAAFFQINWVVKVVADEFCAQVEINIFINFCVDFCTQIVTFHVIITVAQVTVLVQITSRYIIL